MMRRPWIVLVLLFAACASDQPVEIPGAEIPFPLTRATPSVQPGVEERAFDIMVVRGRRLAVVERRVTTSLGQAEVAVRTLLAGPTTNEADRGLRTAIPPSTRLLGIAVFGGVAEVDLSQEFQAAAASEGFLLRVAQVVITLTNLRSVTAVRLSIDGSVASVPTDRGRLVQIPVTAADYARLLPRTK